MESHLYFTNRQLKAPLHLHNTDSHVRLLYSSTSQGILTIVLRKVVLQIHVLKHSASLRHDGESILVMRDRRDSNGRLELCRFSSTHLKGNEFGPLVRRCAGCERFGRHIDLDLPLASNQ